MLGLKPSNCGYLTWTILIRAGAPWCQLPHEYRRVSCFLGDLSWGWERNTFFFLLRTTWMFTTSSMGCMKVSTYNSTSYRWSFKLCGCHNGSDKMTFLWASLIQMFLTLDILGNLVPYNKLFSCEVCYRGLCFPPLILGPHFPT